VAFDLRLLDLHPIGAPARAVRPINPLGEDALQTHATGSGVHLRARGTDHIFRQDYSAAGVSQHARQGFTAAYPRLRAKISAVELDQVERIEEHRARATAPGQREAQALKIRDAPIITEDAFAVERGGLHRQRVHRLDDGRHLVAPVLAVAAENPHAVAVATAHEPEAVVFDFIGPVRPIRHRARRRWKARFDPASGMNGRREHLPRNNAGGP
jgi:hypothetical protein